MATGYSKGKTILEAFHAEEKQLQTRRPVRNAIDKEPTVFRKRIRKRIEAKAVGHLGEPVAPVLLDGNS